MLYVALFQYHPNMAATNRIMAYIRGLSEMGVETSVVFFKPDSKFSKVEEDLPYISFIYLWDKYYINIPKLNKISLRFYMKSFVEKLRSGDVVYIYGFPDLLVDVSKRKDIRCFEERTEHNDVHFRGNVKNVTISTFLNACRGISGVIVISQGLRQYYIDNGCQPERVHIVNMIVDNSRFKGVHKQESEDYIAYCGTASNTKDGVDQLIKAFSLVVKKHPQYKLYIVGSTPSKSQRFDNLELVKELNIEENVVFTGVVPSSEIPQLLINASILALDRPNNLQAQHGFPTKLGEYLQTGNPVVITCVGDIPLFFKDKENALIVEPDNPEEFAQKLCWAIEHLDEARSIGERGKKVAELFFNYKIETKKLLKVIS